MHCEHVHEREWDAVCTLCSVAIPFMLTDRVLEMGLGQRTELGWLFCHGMLREALRPGCAEHVVASLSKNLVREDLSSIEKHLEPLMQGRS